MSINYVRIKRMINVGAEPGLKYMAKSFVSYDIDLSQIAKEIEESTSLTEADINSCLIEMQRVFLRHILKGARIHLGNLGTFTTSIKAEAQNTLEDVTVNTIKRVRVNYLPSAKMRNIIKNDAQFKLLNLSVGGYQPQIPGQKNVLLYEEDGTLNVDIETGEVQE